MLVLCRHLLRQQAAHLFDQQLAIAARSHDFNNDSVAKSRDGEIYNYY